MAESHFRNAPFIIFFIKKHAVRNGIARPTDSSGSVVVRLNADHAALPAEVGMNRKEIGAKKSSPFQLPFAALNALPFQIVTRSELGILTGGFLNPKTMANKDSQGLGPKRKIVGPRGKVAYYVADIKEWLEENCRVEAR